MTKRFQKIKQNLSDIIKNQRVKKVITVASPLLGMALTFYLLKTPVLAQEQGLVSIAEELSSGKPLPLTFKGKLKEIGMSTLGLKVYWDPTASQTKKYTAAGRLICCTSALITGAISEYYPAASYGKVFFASCCTASWAGYTGLSIAEAQTLNKGLIKKD